MARNYPSHQMQSNQKSPIVFPEMDKEGSLQDEANCLAI